MADNNDFFREQQDQVEQVEDKIKLGDKEYSNDELSRLVGLGEIAAEAEEKYKTKIDRVWPEFTKKSQQISDYERRLSEAEEKLRTATAVQQTPTSPVLTEDIRRQALEQAEQLGIGPQAMQQMMRQVVREETAARELIGGIDSLMDEAKADGKPVASTEEMLNYMQESGIKNPAIAYEVMFKDELRRVDQTKIESLRRPGMVTTNQSVAGAKQPASVRVTKSNLKQMVEEELSKGGSF